ncbi:universal stress protein [Terrabacter sp. NPDC080008]|uniref:universal stress protein n=1 Tax=Terrabacter sp. NPDC080008 TaxID=3155176 RepID=UPI00344C50C5
MATPRPAGGLVVAGYDGSPASQRALAWAAAVTHALGDALKIVHAVRLVPSRQGYAVRPLSPSLETVAETLVGAPSMWAGRPLARSRVRAVHAFGGPAEELVDASMTADLVVLGTRGHGRARSALMGSVSSAVAAHAYCPVVVLHERERHESSAVHEVPVPGPGREVVCALTPGDDEEHTARIERIVSSAATVASGCSAPLRLVTVRPATGAPKTPGTKGVSYAVGSLAVRHPGLRVTVETLHGDPVVTLARSTRAAGLLVIGAPHEGGVGAVLAGSPAHRIVHDASCPVMLVH